MKSIKSRLVPLYMCGCRCAWFCLVYAFRIAYYLRVRKIRAKARRGAKIQVLFLVSSTSKWKCQTLFDALKQSKAFHPFVAVALQRQEYEELKLAGRLDDIKARVMEDVRFFKGLGDETVLACDLEKMELVSLRNFNPDIVFYQEPGGPLGMHRVTHEGWYSLCCYVPYSIEASDYAKRKDLLHLECHADFHRLMHLIFQWSPVRASFYKRYCPVWRRAGNIIGTGHPMLDVLQPNVKEENEGYVVYAPHFSLPIANVPRALMIGTFMWNGREILDYARKHRETKWVFKPHPNLAWTLVNQAGWSQHDVEEYYKSWETIGMGCYDGGYPEIFRKSRALITDSDSFLFEYPVTGHPVIHLVFQDEVEGRDMPAVRAFLESFYRAGNLDELWRHFNVVLENGLDPKKEERLGELERLGVLDVNAAENILECLKQELAVE